MASFKNSFYATDEMNVIRRWLHEVGARGQWLTGVGDQSINDDFRTIFHVNILARECGWLIRLCIELFCMEENGNSDSVSMSTKQSTLNWRSCFGYYKPAFAAELSLVAANNRYIFV